MFPFYSYANNHTYSSIWFVAKTQKNGVQQSWVQLWCWCCGEELGSSGKCSRSFAGGVWGELCEMWRPLHLSGVGPVPLKTAETLSAQQLSIWPTHPCNHFRSLYWEVNSIVQPSTGKIKTKCVFSRMINKWVSMALHGLAGHFLPSYYWENFLFWKKKPKKTPFRKL